VLGNVAHLLAGLTHAGRNILQRGHAALDRLEWRLQDRAECLELVTAARRAQEDLGLLYEAVRDFATPIVLSYADHDLAALWREAWSEVTAAAPDKLANLTEDFAELPLRCEVDRDRLLQAFHSLLHSALAAGPNPVKVAITCHEAAVAGRPAVVVTVCDNGPVPSADDLPRLFEPFTSPRAPRGHLGPAVAKKLVEAHGGQVSARPAGAVGMEIFITLPRRKS
jgi:signal transduction histidine kinase